MATAGDGWVTLAADARHSAATCGRPASEMRRQRLVGVVALSARREERLSCRVSPRPGRLRFGSTANGRTGRVEGSQGSGAQRGKGPTFAEDRWPMTDLTSVPSPRPTPLISPHPSLCCCSTLSPTPTSYVLHHHTNRSLLCSAAVFVFSPSTFAVAVESRWVRVRVRVKGRAQGRGRGRAMAKARMEASEAAASTEEASAGGPSITEVHHTAAPTHHSQQPMPHHRLSASQRLALMPTLQTATSAEAVPSCVAASPADASPMSCLPYLVFLSRSGGFGPGGGFGYGQSAPLTERGRDSQSRRCQRMQRRCSSSMLFLLLCAQATSCTLPCTAEATATREGMAWACPVAAPSCEAMEGWRSSAEQWSALHCS